MTPPIEGLIQEIGNEVMATVARPADRAFLYAEVEDGVITPNVFFSIHEGDGWRYKFVSTT